MKIEWRCKDVIIVKMNQIIVNDYNPNRMPKTEMDLLCKCIKHYGFLFPNITFKVPDKLTIDNLPYYQIIDGYHRYEALKRLESEDIAIIDLFLPYHDAVQLTVLMNRIKGLHQVELMSDLIIKLEDLGLTDLEICRNLGMEAEEYMRLKQQLGIAYTFKDCKYGNTWEEEH